jgi:tetratricopeptide (TPR) repeat protein
MPAFGRAAGGSGQGAVAGPAPRGGRPHSRGGGQARAAKCPGIETQGYAQYLLGNAPEAERLLAAAAEADPRGAEPLYALGRIYFQEVKLDRAIEQFRKVLALEPGNFRAYDNLGLAYEGLNDVPRALENYRKALDLVHKDHPEYDPVFANVANLLYRQGDFKGSFKYAAETASRNPNSARNFLLTGRALAALEEREQALKWLNQAVAMDPSEAGARYQLAQVYRALGRDEEADRELRALEGALAQPLPHGRGSEAHAAPRP